MIFYPPLNVIRPRVIVIGDETLVEHSFRSSTRRIDVQRVNTMKFSLKKIFALIALRDNNNDR